MITFDVDYFIAKFEAIPDELWCCESFIRQRPGEQVTYCALGHCGASDLIDTAESLALLELFLRLHAGVVEINDGKHGRFDQDTPRARVLAALYVLRARGW